MYSEAVRQRLEALNREPLPAAISAVVPSPLQAPVTRPAAARSTTVSPLGPGLVKPIAGLIRRGEIVCNELGAHLRICLPMEELWPGGERLVDKRQQRLITQSSDPLPLAGRAREGGEAGTRLNHPSPGPSPSRGGAQKDLDAFLHAFPDRAVLLDLETCGLSGSALFLVGLLRRVDGRLAVELLLARDYSEEPAVLASLWQRIDADGVVVTFNGKSFDWPMVVDRSRRHLLFRGCRPPAPQHIDLLHPARRRWRKQLPDCKLQTLERHICGRTRADDIPGSQIPAAYQQYVRTGFEREMDAILLHNAIDLVTLLDLAMRLAG
jgi:uncharacterized protein YprB with RNaseH-like and TPR domain